MKTHLLADVVGPHATETNLFVDRHVLTEVADHAFRSGRHVFVYGRPGDGRTALIHKQLNGKPYSVLFCQPDQQIEDVYGALLAEARGKAVLERHNGKRTAARTSASVPEHDAPAATNHAPPINLDRIGNVLRALELIGFTQQVVVSDFHVLPEETQSTLARDLKPISELAKMRLIIDCAWTSTSRFRDLADRSYDYSAPVHVEPWSDHDLNAVIAKAEPLLNVVFSQEVRDKLIQHAWGSVRLLHAMLYEFLHRYGVLRTQADRMQLSDLGILHESVREVLGLNSDLSGPQPDVSRVHSLVLLKDSHRIVTLLRDTAPEPVFHGYQVWSTCYLIMDYLLKNNIPERQSVLELGCGWGLLSIFCARWFGAKVTATDADERVYPYLQAHAALNHAKIQFMKADFASIGKKQLRDQYAVLGADICFWPELVDPLYKVIKKAVTEHVPLIIIADKNRGPFKTLTRRCQEQFGAELKPWTVDDPEHTEGQLLIIMNQKKRPSTSI